MDLLSTHPTDVPDMSYAAEHGGQFILDLFKAKTVRDVREAFMVVRLVLTLALLLYGIWFSRTLYRISHSKKLDKESRTLELNRHIYMHKLWIGDSKGILALIFDVWKLFFILTIAIYGIQKLVSHLDGSRSSE
jgi:hypothetical protein